MAVIFHKNVAYGGGGGGTGDLTIVEVTKAEYEALTEAEKMDGTKIYKVTDMNVGVKFGSTDISGIGDGTVTGAIDFLNTGLTTRFTYKLVESTTSFKDADGTTSTLGYAGYLDAGIHAKIGTFTAQTTQMFCGTNGGPAFFGVLGKWSDAYYAGMIWSYAYSHGPVYFTYLNGEFRLYKSSVMTNQ